ncbi:MAG: DUF4199 domain-containing protein [Bacteroidota bacterium]
MNPIIRKFGLQIGLLVSIIQILITIYLYNFGSFVDMKFGLLIIFLNILFGVITIFIVKKNLNNSITLRESFSGYFITIFTSMLVSTIFYVGFFNALASDSKKEAIKKELFDFQVQNMKNNNFPEKDIQKNIELSKNSNPFSLSTAVQSSMKFIILYCILGILFSFFIKNKSSFQEIPN